MMIKIFCFQFYMFTLLPDDIKKFFYKLSLALLRLECQWYFFFSLLILFFLFSSLGLEKGSVILC